MKTLIDFISEQDFFKGLTEQQIHTLAEAAKYRRFRTNELVFHDGNLSNRFYVIMKGHVALEATNEQGNRVQFQTAGSGELLGWSWMFSNAMRQLQARAVEPTEVIYFCGDQLRQLCDQDHTLGYRLFRKVAEVMMRRLQATRRLVLEQPAPALAASLEEWQPGTPA